MVFSAVSFESSHSPSEVVKPSESHTLLSPDPDKSGLL